MREQACESSSGPGIPGCARTHKSLLIGNLEGPPEPPRRFRPHEGEPLALPITNAVSSRRWGGCSLRGQQTAAPLKPAHVICRRSIPPGSPRSTDRGPIEAAVPGRSGWAARSLRGQQTAAPLKHGSRRVRREPLPGLRGQQTAAPLKRSPELRTACRLRRSPRSTDRGPIEAVWRMLWIGGMLCLRGQQTAAPLKRRTAWP